MEATARRRPFSRLNLPKEPLTFLQDWLALRRGGQDFMHAPMGHTTQGNSLQAEHPFFRKGEVKSHNEANRPLAPISKEPKPNMDEDNGDGFDGTENLMESRASNDKVSSSEFYSPEDGSSTDAKKGGGDGSTDLSFWGPNLRMKIVLGSQSRFELTLGTLNLTKAW